MSHRYCSCKRILIVLLLSALICGCAGKTVIETGLPPKSLEILSQTIHETDTIVATAQIDLTTAQGHYPVRAALILQKPSCLRLEMLPVIGTPDFILTATPDDMRVYIPSQGEFYSGKPSAENLERFLSWALNIEDIVMIFSGAYPPLAGKNISYESYAEGDLLRVDMKTSSGLSQMIWMDQNGRMAKFTRNASAGREIYQVQYEDYETGSPLAGRITIKMADHVTSISVKYTDVKIEKAMDSSVFELPVPAGIKIIKLD
jgi:outer membrane lipoprotein-sorting protein